MGLLGSTVKVTKKFVKDSVQQAKENSTRKEHERQAREFSSVEQLIIDSERISAVGCRFYEKDVKRVMKYRKCEKDRWFSMACLIVPEPTNKTDKEALMIKAKSYTGEWTRIGYIPSENIPAVNEMIRKGCSYHLLARQNEGYDIPIFSVVFYQ